MSTCIANVAASIIIYSYIVNVHVNMKRSQVSRQAQLSGNLIFISMRLPKHCISGTTRHAKVQWIQINLHIRNLKKMVQATTGTHAGSLRIKTSRKVVTI